MSIRNVSSDMRGGVLLVSCVIIAMFFIFGAALHTYVLGETRATQLRRDRMQALAIAEAGLERALSDLRADLQGVDGIGSWLDGDINGLKLPPDTAAFRTLPYATTDLGNGSYTVELRSVANEEDEIWVRSTGVADGTAQAIQAYVKGQAISCWDNAIFAGSGGNGLLINGNVQIAGSVHILGDNRDADDVALDMGGGAVIVNNHAGMPAALKARIGAVAPTVFEGESVESLEATLRVRHGQVGLSGTASAGGTNVAGNAVKETLDGAYVTDGFAGNAGTANVHADNGFENPYDLEDSIEFPDMNAPFESEPSYLEYLRKRALVIEDPVRLNVLANLTPSSQFLYFDPRGRGSIACDGRGHLAISGIVYIAGNLGFKSTNKSDTINYVGRGSLVATGAVTVEANVLAAGAATFPRANIMAVMTPRDILFTGSQHDAMGLFYAAGKVTSTKQVDVAGSFVSNYFDMGQQVPAIFYVPIPRGCFPPGLIGTQPVVRMSVACWQLVDPPNMSSDEVSAP